jgi:hypothetical protein
VQVYGLETKDFSAVVEFKNSYGELPAAQIAKLPFYGGLTIMYALFSFLWGFLYFQHRRDICELTSIEFRNRRLMNSSACSKLHHSNSVVLGD